MRGTGPAPTTETKDESFQGHVHALDGLRALAVAVVVAFHSHVPGFSGGAAGVDVFFVLSGYLITRLLVREVAATNRIALRAFYMRRFLRLYPALIAAICVALGLAALRIPVFNSSNAALRDTAEGVPFVLLYTSNVLRALGHSAGYLGHTWSLAIEEQFYLVWPPVVLVLRRRPRALFVLAVSLAVASAATRLVLSLAGIDSELLLNATFSHVDGIFLGSALALAWYLYPDLLARVSKPVLVAPAFACLVLVVSIGRSMAAVGYGAAALATAVILSAVIAAPDSVAARALSARALCSVGRRSYGLYLYHWPVFLFVGIDTRLHVLAVGYGLSLALTYLSFRWLEMPFLRRKERWR